MDNIKWLFFDVGYTLVNEDKCHEKRIMDTVRRFKDSNKNLTYESLYKAMLQASMDYKQPYVTALMSFGIDYYEPYVKELEFPYDNAKPVLDSLHKLYQIGIIANQTAGTAKRLTEFGLLEHIDLVMSSAEEGVEKPDIRIYERALQKSGCKAAEAVMIGDRLDNDIFPAKRAGMATVWIKQGFGGMQIPKSKDYMPDHIIHNLEELTDLFNFK